MSETQIYESSLANREENVVIGAGECAITLIPALGGKIASLRVGAHELLQSPLRPLAPRTRTMAFSDADASGWDECLPSVADCIIDTDAGPAAIPDHGDLWRIPWLVLDASPDSATMRARCFSLPLQLTRSLLLTETTSGWQLQLLYSLTNLGAWRVPWSWSAHPLFAVDPGDRVVLSNQIKTVRLEGSAGNRLGVSGASLSWPRNNGTDFTRVSNSDAAIGDKLFAGPLGSTEQGSCILERPQAGLRLTVRFDPLLTPYLGLWLCYGGWPSEPGPKQFCVAPEPCTAPVDSLAKTGTWSRWLDPGETVNWPMELTIDRMPPVNCDPVGKQ